jgi:hypothetical protein
MNGKKEKKLIAFCSTPLTETLLSIISSNGSQSRE